MVTEDYVSFDTAKLLKEKGFIGDVQRWYVISAPEEGVVTMGFGNETDYAPAPTIQMTMKWLRAIHKIDITIDPHDVCSNWIYQFHLCHNREYLFSRDVDTTYEGACEAAIKYCLEHLI